MNPYDKERFHDFCISYGSGSGPYGTVRDERSPAAGHHRTVWIVFFEEVVLEYDSDGSHILDGLIFLRMMSLVALNH